MKKIIVIFLTLISCVSIKGDTVIKMEAYGGVYRIPCVVNGAKMKFIFDTGASDVCLSMAMAEYLHDNGFIEDDDIIGTGESQVADGRIVDHIRLKLRDIQIADLHIYNVNAIVVEGQNAPLLMGQSAIQKLGSIEINGSMLTIKNGNGQNASNYIDDLRNKISQANDNRQYEKVLELYILLDDVAKLSDLELYDYAEVLFLNHQPEKTIQILNRIDNIQSFDNGIYDPYHLYAVSYLDLKQFDKARRYMKLSNERYKKTTSDLAEGYEFIGDCYYYQDMDRNAGEEYVRALNTYAKSFGIDTSYLIKDCMNELKKNQKSYRNDHIDELIFKIVRDMPDVNSSLSNLQKLARARNRHAIEFLNKAGIIDYYN